MTLTTNETEVLNALKNAPGPRSAYDILQDLKGSKLKAAVQVYRALEKLQKLGLTHRVESLNAFVVCDCKHKGNPAGFLVCTCCGSVKEFDAGKTVIAANRQFTDFRVQDVNMEVKGLCNHCQIEPHTHGAVGTRR